MFSENVIMDIDYKPFPKLAKREDDEEIEELAKKIKIYNEKRMTSDNTATAQPDTQLFSIPDDVDSSEDRTSKIGQFGWHEILKTFIPYLIRSDKKLVSRRMAEAKLLKGIREVFSNDLLHCVEINIYGATLAESKLLNEINVNHSDNVYGNVQFLEGEPLMLLNDVKELVRFICFCCKVLQLESKPEKKRCGYIKINEDSVPYVWSKNRQYVPLFYFEGESQYLEERAVRLGDWDMSYIKFACKVQGIRKEFYDKPDLQFVDLELLKQFFPPNTFVESWPNENKLNYLVTQKSSFKQPNENFQTATNINQSFTPPCLPSLNQQDNNRLWCAPNTNVTYTQTSIPSPNVSTNYPALHTHTLQMNSPQTNQYNQYCSVQSTESSMTTIDSSLRSSVPLQMSSPQTNQYNQYCSVQSTESSITTIDSSLRSSVPLQMSSPQTDQYIQYCSIQSTDSAMTTIDFSLRPALAPLHSRPSKNTNNSTSVQLPITYLHDLQRAVLTYDALMMDCINYLAIEVLYKNFIMVSLERVAISYFKTDPVVFTDAVVRLGIKVFKPTEIQATLLKCRGVSRSFGMLRLLDIKQKLESFRNLLHFINCLC